MVLDASAVLAVVFEEPGSEVALASIRGGLVSTVNAVEIFEKGARRHVAPSDLAELLDRLEVATVPFDLAQARIAADLKALPQCKGLSLGDRSCLALSIDRALPVLTADRAWAALDLGIDIRLIR